MDWDITFTIINSYDMEKVTSDCTNRGACTRYRQLKEAEVYINKDTENEKDFLSTIIHEILHVTTDNFMKTAFNTLDLIENKKLVDVLDNDMDIEYEQMVNVLSKCIVNCLPNNYLNQFLIK